MNFKPMTYRDYQGSIEPDLDSNMWRGKIIGIRDLVMYKGKTTGELYKKFQEAVDDYIEFRLQHPPK